MIRTPAQNRHLHLLLGKHGIDSEAKKDMVYSYTEGRTTKSSEMTRVECKSLINNLEYSTPEEIASNQMRRKIIALFRKQGYKLENGKADMLAIGSWCEKYGYKKKPLNSYKYNELPKLVTQAENMYSSFIKTI